MDRKNALPQRSNLFSSTAYALRWMEWLIKYAVIWPAAVLMLLMMLMFRLDHSSPGQAMAQEVARVTRDAGPGEYRVCDASEKISSSGNSLCIHTVLTDANGYAKYIDGTLQPLPRVWLVMALAFTLLAYYMGIRPYRDSGASTHSVRWRYGRKFVPEDTATSSKEKDDE